MEQGMLYALWFAGLVILIVSSVVLMVFAFSPIELHELYDDEPFDE